MAADEFPLGEVMHLDDAVYFGFSFDELVESDILKQVFEIAIIAGYVGGEWGAVVVFFEDCVSGLPIEAHALNVHPGEGACLLLEDGEDIAVEAGLVNAHHVRKALAKIAGEDKHISDALQVSKILRSPVDNREIEVIDMTHLVGRECYLLVAIGWQFNEVVGGRYPGVVACAPSKSCAKLRAERLDGGQSQSSLEEKGNKVMPKDIGHLVRFENTTELALQLTQVVLE